MFYLWRGYNPQYPCSFWYKFEFFLAFLWMYISWFSCCFAWYCMWPTRRSVFSPQVTHAQPLQGRSAVLGEHRGLNFVGVACGGERTNFSTYAVTSNGLLMQFSQQRTLEKFVTLKVRSGACFQISAGMNCTDSASLQSEQCMNISQWSSTTKINAWISDNLLLSHHCCVY